MNISISTNELKEYTRNQMRYFFPDQYDFKGKDVDIAFELALERTEECFKVISHPGYHNEKGEITFSHLHGDQYASFIYFLSNSLWKTSQNKPLCDKLLQLNRLLFTIFISYKNNLCDHFLLGHAYGTILGNAKYDDYLVVSQGVTVNSSTDNMGNWAPVIGKGVFLGAHAKIIGNKNIGDRVSIGVNAMVYNQEVPNDFVVMNIDGKNVIKQRGKEICFAQKYFNVDLRE